VFACTKRRLEAHGNEAPRAGARRNYRAHDVFHKAEKNWQKSGGFRDAVFTLS
jgi:hypothetical protein